MNIEQAKAIPLPEILCKLGFESAREPGRQSWYLSPLRSERTPSFHVHLERNVWYDHGDGRGGNTLDFAIHYLQMQGKPGSVPDALRFLSDIMGGGSFSSLATPTLPKPVKSDPVLELVSLKSVQHPALVQYLQARGIDVEIARLYLKQASVRNAETGKRFFALACKNEDEGYELRNPYFKRAISPKAITFIRGSVVKPDGLHVFEGFTDFLSVLTREKADRLQFDTIVLNSVSLLEQTKPYIKDYGYSALFCWMHNDAAGKKAAAKLEEFARAERNLTLYRMNEIYAPHNDVNDWHIADLGLPPLQP